MAGQLAGADVDRAQLHRNASRGLPYLSTATAGAPHGPTRFEMTPIAKIDLDGDPVLNVRGNVYPIDAHGDGRFELLHFNGSRFMRVYDLDGRMLWQVDDPDGRVHRDFIHRDTLAVFYGDQNGGQDIAHCWIQDGRKKLVLRRGSDGAVLKSVDLGDPVTSECQIAAFRTGAANDPVILVSHAPGESCAAKDQIDTFSSVLAFDRELRPLWTADTCMAGHYVWPIGPSDGPTTSVMVGKYVVDLADGHIRCNAPNWDGDHADSVSVADFLPDRPGPEAVLIGRTRVAMIAPLDGCVELWTNADPAIDNTQHLQALRLEADAPPSIVLRQRGSVRPAAASLLEPQGRILLTTRKTPAARTMPSATVNLDGARGEDDLVGQFGRVVDPRTATERLGTAWYWSLKGTKIEAVKPPSFYDRWAAFPLVLDLDRDGRDEMVVWSQTLIVVGTLADGVELEEKDPSN
ncbi:MAG: hypothetical protein U1E45_08190 [Geminicoccaceae bacterium]